MSVSTGFIFGAAHENIPWLAVLGLVIGGVIVAPIAAALAGKLPHAPMGTLVGGLVMIVNGDSIIKSLGGVPAYGGFPLVGLAAVAVGTLALRVHRTEKAEKDQELVAA